MFLPDAEERSARQAKIDAVKQAEPKLSLKGTALMIDPTKSFRLCSRILVFLYCLIVFGANWFIPPDSHGQTIPPQLCTQRAILFVAAAQARLSD
jgi:hypothetical protein